MKPVYRFTVNILSDETFGRKDPVPLLLRCHPGQVLGEAGSRLPRGQGAHPPGPGAGREEGAPPVPGRGETPSHPLVQEGWQARRRLGGLQRGAPPAGGPIPRREEVNPCTTSTLIPPFPMENCSPSSSSAGPRSSGTGPSPSPTTSTPATSPRSSRRRFP